MKTWPLQFRPAGGSQLLFSDDTGSFFMASKEFLGRYVRSNLSDADKGFLAKNGQSFNEVGDYLFTGFASRWARRLNSVEELSYLILVPTLRCNLMCDYCQVSRAAENAKGFDWDEERVAQVIAFLGELKTPDIKIEFQGGEPLLRLDILETIRTFCRARFERTEFVICTNLQEVSEQAWRFLDADDTHVSTSFDGTDSLHQKRRTKSDTTHTKFEANLNKALSILGENRVSALPTIDPSDPPSPRDLIDNYVSLGFTSIFLRRINYQGFARKKYDFDKSLDEWIRYYRDFIAELIAYNATASLPVEEFYLSHLLRRIVRSDHQNHVDLRNPNWLGMDYLVVDFDGTLYPTDEARMVSRVGRIDLSIGTLSTGIDSNKRKALNEGASNFDDPDCMHCVYKAYCGLDLVDDLSRYGRIDMPRHKTDHCKSHLNLFDFVFELLYSEDETVQKSLASWLGVARYSPALAPRLL
jgi:His-Xaa-Ser system radical SAM maturase HxsB